MNDEAVEDPLFELKHLARIREADYGEARPWPRHGR
jgi:hypothetical protein